ILITKRFNLNQRIKKKTN
ncbi:hypothetical protein CP061683_0910B, partial [Chlamydia psittaci 06-1683]